MARPIAVLPPDQDVLSSVAVPFDPALSFESFRDAAAAKMGFVGGTHSLALVDGDTGDDVKDNDALQRAKWLRCKATKDIVEEIPGPAPRAFIGNLPDITGPDPKDSVRKLFDQYGPVMKITFPGNSVVYYTNDPDCIQTIANESPFFTKRVELNDRSSGILGDIKLLAGEGLFTTSTTDPVWKLAHKLLMPAFSAKAIRSYGQDMSHVAMAATRVFDVFADTREPCEISQFMTQIALQTIAKCGFGFDFRMLDPNNVQASPHRFVQEMSYTLDECLAMSRQSSLTRWWHGTARLDESINYQQQLVAEVLAHRKKDPEAEKRADLLQFMLNNVDPATNAKMSDIAIRDNCITFLIAGHETTASTMSWFFYLVSRNPSVERKLLQELVDAGLSAESTEVTLEQLKKMPYMEQTIFETLRMYPPAAAFSKLCIRDAIIPSSEKSYSVRKGDRFLVSLDALHYNPKIWPNPHRFDPDRFAPEATKIRHPYAWLPFSTGMRGCIGREFTVQEMRIVLPLLLARYHFVPLTPDAVKYNSQGLTTRPLNYQVRVERRVKLPAATVAGTLPSHPTSPLPGTPAWKPVAVKEDVKLPLVCVLYGSFTGTCEDFAHDLTAMLGRLGFKDVITDSLDHFLLNDGLNRLRAASQAEADADMKPLLAIVTSTNNGTPPDNAEAFSAFLSDKQGERDTFAGINYTVFGAGNSQWRTYQEFPVRIDSLLESLGGRRYFEKGIGDANDDLEGHWRGWSTRFLSFLYEQFGINASSESLVLGVAGSAASAEVSFISPDEEAYATAVHQTNGKVNGKIIKLEELQDITKSGRSTLHIEIGLPEGMTYAVGDHLEVYPQNDPTIAEEVAIKLGLAPSAAFRVESCKGAPPRSLAYVIKEPCTVQAALTYYADLLSPPPRSLLSALAARLRQSHPQEYEVLRVAAEGDVSSPESVAGREAFLKKYRTVLEVLRHFAVHELLLGDLLVALQAMQPRRYSISSSPLVRPNSVTICVGVVATKSEDGQRVFPGQASGFLSRCAEGSLVRIAVKSVQSSFSPPEDPSRPLTMVCAGTGIAPFLGFLEHRHKLGFKSTKMGGSSTTILFFGCRNEHDFIYKERLHEYLAAGTLDLLYVTFSRTGAPQKYVQHAIMAHSLELWKLRKTVSFYVCGSANGMAKDVKETITKIAGQIGGRSQKTGEQWMSHLIEQNRYNEDVWG